MQNPKPPIMNIPPEADNEDEIGGTAEAAQQRIATVWVSRLTSIVGGICLVVALVLWLVRPEHYRLVLAFLVVAMFAAILHSYTFENGGH
jgi:predicted RND superfamily exporter protein